MKTAVTFFRVSTQKQENERQKQDVRKYCKGMQYNIIAEYEETLSGSTELEQRKELQRCLKYVKENKPDFFIVSELSRLARTADVHQIIKELTDYSVCLISLKENLKTLNDDKTINPITNLIISVLAGINQFELETIRYRIKSGKYNSVINNKYQGGAYIKFGYKVIDKYLVIDKEEAETVKLIFELTKEKKWSYNKVAKYLSNNNIKTRKRKVLEAKIKNGEKVNNVELRKSEVWDDSTVYNILNNSIYIGKRKYKGDIIEDESLRIIDDYTYNKVQELLKQRLLTNNKLSKKKYEYLLDNKIIKCQCGEYYYSKKNRYICNSGRTRKGCGNRAIDMNYLDNRIQEYIIKNYTDLIINNTDVDNKLNNYIIEKEQLEKDLKNEENKNDRYLDLYGKGIIDEIKLEKNIKQSNDIINNIKNKIQEYDNKINEINKITNNLFSANFKLNNQTGKYEKESFNIDKNTLHSIISLIYVEYDDVNRIQTITVKLINEAQFQFKLKRKIKVNKGESTFEEIE